MHLRTCTPAHQLLMHVAMPSLKLAINDQQFRACSRASKTPFCTARSFLKIASYITLTTRIHSTQVTSEESWWLRKPVTLWHTVWNLKIKIYVIHVFSLMVHFLMDYCSLASPNLRCKKTWTIDNNKERVLLHLFTLLELHRMIQNVRHPPFSATFFNPLKK